MTGLSSIHRKSVELILSSISKNSDIGFLSSFFFGRPGAPHWDKRMGINIYYDQKRMIRAVLYVRQHGPAYLKYLSVDDIRSKLQTFVSDNFWYMANDTYLRQFEGSFAENVSEKAKDDLAAALAVSPIFAPRNELTLFPLSVVTVEADFDSAPFFLVSPQSLDGARLPEGSEEKWIVSTRFPPVRDWKGKTGTPSAWLGVRSPAVQASQKMKAAILGALALTPLPAYRHMFSGRTVLEGRCTIGAAGVTSSFDDTHTPPMMHDLVIGENDHRWLSALSEKLQSGERATRRQLRALEYFYRAWPLAPSERFAVLCMTLDAVFGDANHASQAVIDGVRTAIGDHVSDVRLRRLMDLRASVIHGGAPDVYDSRKYGRYYDEFDTDPIHDLELVVGECLRVSVFEGALREHADPNAAIIAEAQAKGRLPKDLSRSTILDEPPEHSAAAS
jgi:hypothetical protein